MFVVITKKNWKENGLLVYRLMLKNIWIKLFSLQLYKHKQTMFCLDICNVEKILAISLKFEFPS